MDKQTAYAGQDLGRSFINFIKESDMIKVNLDVLCKRINYHFKNRQHLQQALTHRSASVYNYERFEFLGDSILSFTIANELFHLFPQKTEGQLSRLRSTLVKGDTLAEVAKEIDLGNFLFLGQGELKTGGFRRISTLADALEALFAAVYLDGGIEAAKTLILSLYHTRLHDPNLTSPFKDAKTELQEYLQAGKRALPQYTLIKVEGNEHEQLFYISCSVNGIAQDTQGVGSNRRKAEQLAAHEMLLQITHSE